MYRSLTSLARPAEGTRPSARGAADVTGAGSRRTVRTRSAAIWSMFSGVMAGKGASAEIAEGGAPAASCSIVVWGHGEAMSDGVVDQTWIVRSLKVGAHLLPLLRRNGPEELIQNLIQFVSCTVRCHECVPSIDPRPRGDPRGGPESNSAPWRPSDRDRIEYRTYVLSIKGRSHPPPGFLPRGACHVLARDARRVRHACRYSLLPCVSF